jgi:hypothetical protein
MLSLPTNVAQVSAGCWYTMFLDDDGRVRQEELLVCVGDKRLDCLH